MAVSDDGGISVWAYRTGDPAESLLENGYFDGGAALLGLADRIHVFADMDHSGAHLDLAVTYRSKNRVRVAPMASAAPVR